MFENVVYSDFQGPSRPWILLGQKQNLAQGNTVEDGYAHSFDFRADPSVRARRNRPVTRAIYRLRRAALERRLALSFGAIHAASGSSSPAALGAR